MVAGAMIGQTPTTRAPFDCQDEHMHPNPLTFSARLWQQIETVYEEILAHPFLTGLTDGTLDEKTFAHYVAQDVHYLRDYARALSIVAAKAPTLADTAMFARHAAEVFDVELGLHGELLPELGLDAATLEAEPVGPTTQAYTSYLLATAYAGSFADGLAAVLPCYWIYARVGAELMQRGSSDPRYSAGSTATAARSSRRPSPRCSRSPIASVRHSAKPNRPPRSDISWSHPATSGCSSTPRTAASSGRCESARESARAEPGYEDPHPRAMSG